jgi:ankyrin repeat protein
MLLEAGADANAVDEFGRNILFGAVKHGHDETAKVLIAKGAR